MAMIGSLVLRDSIDSMERSPLLAPASAPAAISTARLATARYKGRSRVCLRFGFTQRMVMRAPKGPTKTVQDWLALPNDARIELIDGELVEKAAPTFEHGRAQGRTVGAIVGPFDVHGVRIVVEGLARAGGDSGGSGVELPGAMRDRVVGRFRGKRRDCGEGSRWRGPVERGRLVEH